jgi:hypothetical protein
MCEYVQHRTIQRVIKRRYLSASLTIDVVAALVQLAHSVQCQDGLTERAAATAATTSGTSKALERSDYAELSI